MDLNEFKDFSDDALGIAFGGSTIRRPDDSDVYEMPKLRANGYEGYLKAIVILTDLKRKGYCDFEIDSIIKAYHMHAIIVKWKSTDGFLYMDKYVKKAVKDLWDCTESCTICDEEGTSWMFTSRIYIPENEEKGK